MEGYWFTCELFDLVGHALVLTNPQVEPASQYLNLTLSLILHEKGILDLCHFGEGLVRYVVSGKVTIDFVFEVL